MTNGIYVSLEELVGLRILARDCKLRKAKSGRATHDGQYRSSRRGRGMEFADVRQYQAGDDVRNIDWKITARTQSTYTKLFEEEKERPVVLLVDQRSPMFFGSKLQFKSVLATKLAGLISWSAFQNKDRIGALIFSDREQADLRPKHGKHSVLHCLNKLTEFNQRLTTPLSYPQSSNGDSDNTLASMLVELRRVCKPGSLVYLISDFHDLDEQCKKHLALLARHNDLVFFSISDPLEKQLPKNVDFKITDGLQETSINTTSAAVGDTYTRLYNEHEYEVASTATSLRARYHALSTDSQFASLAPILFSPRAQRRAL